MSSNRFITSHGSVSFSSTNPNLISRFYLRPGCCSHISETLKAFFPLKYLGQMGRLVARRSDKFGQVSFYRYILSRGEGHVLRGSSSFLLQFFASMAALWVWMILLSLLQMAHCAITNRHAPGKPHLFLEVPTNGSTINHTYLTRLL